MTAGGIAMKISLKYFSIYRSLFCQEEANREYPEYSSVQDIFLSHFKNDEEALKYLKFTRFAVNAEYVPVSTLLNEGDELVFIPPISGG